MLRLLIVLNWLFAAAILVLLLVMPHERWLMISLNLSPSPEATRIVWGMRAIAIIGLVTIPLYHLILTRLLAIVGTVRAGDPFVAANATRLQAIAWIMVGLQVLGIVIAIIVRMISTPGASDRYRARARRSPACSPSCSPSCSPACSPRARGCATTSKGRCDMAIAVKLDDLLHARRMTLTELAERVGITIVNLSILKTGKARAIRFSTLEAICAALACQPGDILEYLPDEHEEAKAA